jgi:hypothetical protein
MPSPQQPQFVDRPSGRAKFWGTVFVAGISLFWYMLMVVICWETASFKCRPNLGQVVCNISDSPYPGEARNFNIPKAQLSGVKVIKQRTKPYHRKIVLISTDRKEIPLTRNWGGEVNLQLARQIDKIEAFIADPQSQTISIETHRNFPFLLLLMTGGIVWFNGLLLKRLWFGVKT